MSGVLVVMEQRAGVWHRMSWETLAAGQQLAAQIGQSISAAVVGQAAELVNKKVDRVYTIEHELLATYTADGYTAALEQLIRKLNPSLVLFPHTYQVRDFAPKLATRFNQVLISDSIGFHVESRRARFSFASFSKVQVKRPTSNPAAPNRYISHPSKPGAFRADQVQDGKSRRWNNFTLPS